MQEELTGDTASTELFAKALTTLGLVGLLMAVCGLYGLTAHLAALRGREFGIKKALGATNLLLSRTVAVEGLPALLKGLGAGTLIGILAGFWLRSRQFHTLQPFDAIPLLAVGGVLLVAGLAGNLLPFRRLLQREASDLLKEP
jgi:ABC-type antimicrobial peptide transport system permease subunit